MKLAKTHSYLWLIGITLILLLQACGTTGIKPGKDKPASEATASKALDSGQYLVAAKEYQRLVDNAKRPKREDYQLKAIAALIQAGQTSEARRQLDGVNTRGLSPNFLARKRVLLALIATQEGSPLSAIRLLDKSKRMRNLDPEVNAEIFRIKAAAEQSLGNTISAVKNLVVRERYLSDPILIDQNQLRIWESLAVLPLTELKQQEIIAREPVLAGWLKLAILYNESPGRFRKSANEWKKAHPEHTLTETVLETIGSPGPRFVGRVEKIALLLPLTSRYGKAAKAVREGFMAMANLDKGADKPKIKIYDIGEDPRDAKKFYYLAVDEGADLVVGPLGRDAVDYLADKADFDVPTLLLSHTEEGSSGISGAVFQFGLTPEQEAMQAAERAYLDGKRQIAILYPDSEWGERLRAAFSDHWHQLGGLVVVTQAYDESLKKDYAEPIKRILNINQSEKRKEDLEILLKRNIKFTPRPREDADAIFLVASAKSGRQLKPHLNYFDPYRHIEVYATSKIYNGKPNPIYDRDLDGIMFGDMPWLLVQEGSIANLREQQPSGYHYGQPARLYAMGMDSYAIIPYLNRISAESAIRFNGVTSGLSLDQFGRLQRQLLWAKFRNGVPKLLDNNFSYSGTLGFQDDASPNSIASAPRP